MWGNIRRLCNICHKLSISKIHVKSFTTPKNSTLASHNLWMSPKWTFFMSFEFKRCVINFCLVLNHKIWVIYDSSATTYGFLTSKVSTVISGNVLISMDRRSVKINGSTSQSDIFCATAWVRKLPIEGLEKAHGKFLKLLIQCVAKGMTSSWLWVCLRWNDPKCQAYKWHSLCR